MAVTTQSAQGLVPGAKPQQQEPVKVRLLRAICVAGARMEPECEIDVDRATAAMLIGSGKAARVVAPATEAPPSTSADAPVAPSTTRGRPRGRTQE